MPSASKYAEYAEYAGKNFLIMADRFSSCAFCEETKDKTIAPTIKVMKIWFKHFGYPNKVRADDGPAFRAGFTEWLQGKNVIRETSSAYNSQSNGLAERAVKRCKDTIKKNMDEGVDWRTGLEEMRSVASPALGGRSPAEVFHGGRKLTRQVGYG